MAIPNIGSHLSLIELENPRFYDFIMYSTTFMPKDNRCPLEDITNPSLKDSLMSDLSTGYTILTFCQTPNQSTSS